MIKPVIQVPIRSIIGGDIVGYLIIDADNYLFGKIESNDFAEGIRKHLTTGGCDSVQIRMNPARVSEPKTEPLSEDLVERQLEVYRNLHQNH